MNIVVCIKQTPLAAEAKIDEATKRLVREGVTLSVSTIDRRATLEALRLRQQVGGTVTVITMGPPQARTALQELLALGADDAVLLTDPAFAGSDTLATSRALSAAIRRLDPDLVMCGKFTVDSETSQVPSEVAEMLGRPQVTSVRAIKPTQDPRALWVERETDEGFERMEVPLPALLSVTELITTNRRPTPEDLQTGAAKPLQVWSAADIGIDPKTVGLAGSPTRVADLRDARLDRKGIIIPGEDAEAAAQKVLAYMLENGLFSTRKANVALQPRRAAPRNPDPRKAVWVVAELVMGQLRPVTFELLGKAQDLADKLGGEVAAVLVGPRQAAEFIPTLAAHGADIVYASLDDKLTHYDTLLYTDVLATAIRRHSPYAVLMPSTTNGRDWAPRVAARLQLGLTGDCVDLELDPDGELAQVKPAFGGNIVVPIYSTTSPAMATVRPGMLEARAPRRGVHPVVSWLDVPAGDRQVRLVGSQVEPELGATKMDDADIVIAVGKGVGGPQNVPAVRELANVLDAAVAASLGVTSAGWMPPQVQIGLTGKAVAPQFYIALGVSGHPNHLMGVKKAQHIIVVNKDPQAPIFKSADIGIVGDWSTFVPALTRAAALAKARADE